MTGSCMHTANNPLKFHMNIEDFIKITPHRSEDGTVLLGSKKTNVFVADAMTGRLVCIYRSLDFTSTLFSGEEQTAKGYNDRTNKGLMMPGPVSNPQVIYVTRTDYALQTFASSSDKVSWNMEVAVIEAAFLCQEIENPTTLVNSTYELGFEVGDGFDMPWSCQSRRMVVRRHGKPHSYFGSGAIFADEKLQLPVPASNPMLPSWPRHDNPLDNNYEMLMLPGSTANPVLPLLPKVDKPSNVDLSGDSEGIPALPNDSAALQVHDASMPHKDALSSYYNWSSVVSLIYFVVIIVSSHVLYQIS